MASLPRVDLYYLDRRKSDMTNLWKYYRVSSVFERSIETCEVEFPSLKDKGPATDHLWIVGLESAHAIKGDYLKAIGINQDDAILIGMVVHEK